MMTFRTDFLRYFEKLIFPYSWRIVDTALGIGFVVFVVLPVFVFWLIGKTVCPVLINGDSYGILRYILFGLYVVYLVGFLNVFALCGAVNNRRHIQELKEKLEEIKELNDKDKEEIQKEIDKLTKQCDRILGEN